MLMPNHLNNLRPDFAKRKISCGSIQAYRFEATLAAMLQEGRAQLVNEPRITTQNNMPGEVDFTTTIPYFSAQVTYNEFGQRTVDYTTDSVDVDQSLYVTPRINGDDSITLQLSPNISDQVGQVVGPNGEVVPIVSSQTATTQVTVGDGQTLCIGGLIRKNESVNTKLTPLLSSIPIIGELFKGKTKTVNNSELLIFITPEIIHEWPQE